MRILGLDPSINHYGWGGIDTSNGKPALFGFGVIRCSTDQGDDRHGIIARALDRVMEGFEPDLVVVERPTFENSARGKECWQKGFDRLCAVAGSGLAVAAVRDIPYRLVTAREWKHRFPKPRKPNIRRRVEEVLGEHEWPREDAWEALGLALWAWRNKGENDEY